MALCSDAAMVLMYDIAGDPADHDDWHSREHFHERLSVPGFLRATRWVATEGGPRFLVTYEVESVEVLGETLHVAVLGGDAEARKIELGRSLAATRRILVA